MSDATSNPFVAAVREIGPSLAARAADGDQSGAFVSESYAVLKERRLLSAGGPKDLGGGGASHSDLCEMLRELALFCPSTALALSMHTHLVAAAVWRHLHGQPAAPLSARSATPSWYWSAPALKTGSTAPAKPRASRAATA
jgi:alkylation response protein AidB-like acyl-CoA dehydrogenase